MCESLFPLIAQEKTDLGLQHSLTSLLIGLPDKLCQALQQKYIESAPHLTAVRILNESLIEPLTKRETQVMALVKKGLSNKEIAETLFISLNTLKVHIRNLYGKMGVDNRTQALLKMNQ